MLKGQNDTGNTLEALAKRKKIYKKAKGSASSGTVFINKAK